MGIPSHRQHDGPDWYAVLGVDPSATSAEIRAAYRRRALALHAERLHSTAAPRTLARAYDRLEAISGAYRVLREPETRRAYDLARDARSAATLDPAPAVRRSQPGYGSRITAPARSQQGRRRQRGRIAVVIGFGLLVLVAIAINIVERRQVEESLISGPPRPPAASASDR